MLREARASTGLSQRQLAHLAATAQSAIARYESGLSLPDLTTLQRVLAACGWTLTVEMTRVADTDLRQLRESLALSPRQRLERNRRISRLAAKAAAARRAGRVRRLEEP